MYRFIGSKNPSSKIITSIDAFNFVTNILCIMCTCCASVVVVRLLVGEAGKIKGNKKNVTI